MGLKITPCKIHILTCTYSGMFSDLSLYCVYCSHGSGRFLFAVCVSFHTGCVFCQECSIHLLWSPTLPCLQNCLKDGPDRNNGPLYECPNPLGIFKNIFPLEEVARHVLIFGKMYFAAHWSTRDYQVKSYISMDASFCDANCIV